MKTLCNKFVIALTLTLFLGVSITIAQTTFKFGGFSKFDYISTTYTNMSVGEAEPFSDFHIPSLIPVGGDLVNTYNKMHVKESRFNFDVTSKINEKPIRVFVEMDFMLSGHGDERVSNSYNPRLRHFFFDYNGLLFGQTWSTFMIVTLPDDLDFIGAAEGVVFVRQPQIRYTLKGDHGSWQFAVENPESTVSPTIGGGRSVYSGGAPDVIVRKNFKTEALNLSIATMGRLVNNIDQNGDRMYAPAFGLTTGGKIKIGSKDDMRFVFTGGKGIGRYQALNFINCAVYDGTDKLKTRYSVNGFFAYTLNYTDKLRSSFNVSAFFTEDDGVLPNADGLILTNKRALSGSANFIYAPSKKVLFGIEYMYADRVRQDQVRGSFHRIQISARYAFGYSHTTAPKE